MLVSPQIKGSKVIYPLDVMIILQFGCFLHGVLGLADLEEFHKVDDVMDQGLLHSDHLEGCVHIMVDNIGQG